MEDAPEISNDIVKKLPEDESLNTINPDAPEIASKIVKHVPTPKTSVGMEVQFTPYDHTTTEVPVNPATAAFGGDYNKGQQKEIGYFEGSLAQWEGHDDTWKLAHGGWDRLEDARTGSYKDPNFNPLQFQDKFIDIRSEFQPYLLSSENEDQMNFRINRIHHEQWVDDTIKNGSWMQWITGAGLAIPTDLINYIPIVGQMKYARFGKTVLNSAARNIPGGVAYGVGSSLGDQVDKINGNMTDFLHDSMIRSVFAITLFGAAPILGLTADNMALWNLRSYVSDAVKGIGYKLSVGEKGEVKGLQSYDMTPNQSLSADVVKLAQDKADSAFHKNGLFKIPYIGTAAENVMKNSFLGSTALSMLTSPFESVRAVIDLAYDHGITTKGLAEGKTKPIPFFSLMAQVQAHIRQEQSIFNALHAERNGIKSDNYVSQAMQKAGMYTRDKTLKKIGAEIGDRPYISVNEFSDEVQQVIHSGDRHEDPSVNVAAEMFRNSMDKFYVDWRKAYNLPDDFMPPKTAQAYLMRVYDTNYLNNNLGAKSIDGKPRNEGGWIPVISNELRKQDNTILEFTAPIEKTNQRLEAAIAEKEAYGRMMNVPDHVHKETADLIESLKIQKKVQEDKLSNDIRDNPRLHLLAEDWNDLTANEANELTQITKRRDISKQRVEEIKQKISAITEQAKKREGQALKGKTEKTVKSNLRKSEIGKAEAERIKLNTDLAGEERALDEEEKKLQEQMYSGKINRRFYREDKEGKLILKDPSERIKLRKTYHEQPGYRVSEAEAHEAREEHAKAYYDTIMNQTAEDTINQIMGKFTGNSMENHTKQRTINIPDQVLYDNNFMTKDLLSKVANYKMWLARRTHLQNVYKGLSINGGFQPIIRDIQEQFDRMHSNLNAEKNSLQQKLAADNNLSLAEKKKLQKGLQQVEDNIKDVRKQFNKGKEQVQFAYEKMAGISRLGKRAKSIVSGIKAFNVAANLGFLPLTMITDLSANGLKQGLIPFIVDGVYPTISSLGGFLKTHDSQSLRDTAGALNLALHHIGNSTASRQMDLSTNPYLNAGRIPAGLDKLAHFTSNVSFTTAIDNYLQRVTSAVAQSNVIRHLMAFEKGELSKSDRMWLNKYGIDPEKDANDILKAFRKDGGGSNKLGGYQSNFWHWEDTKAANKVSDAVFRSTHDTIISANSLDAPIWLDENGLLGMMAPIIRGFKGWAFASLNRYLIPSLQTPDAQKLMGFAVMSASAALVSPSRRMARGQDPYTNSKGNHMTPIQIGAEILMDSPQFSWLSEALNDANLISHGTLLGDLKNDKYYDRTLMGIMGPTGSNLNKLSNFITSMATGNMNQQDTMGMASMIPVLNSAYGYNASQHILKGFGLPKYRGQ